jgi:HEAT repeat protein
VGAGDVDGLRAALAYRDGYVATDGRVWDVGAATRIAAARGLADVGGETAGQALVGALEDPNTEVKVALVDALAALETPIDPEPLVQALIDWRAQGDDVAADRALAVLAESKTDALAETFAGMRLPAEAPPLGEPDREALGTLLSADPRPDARARLAEQLAAALQETPEDLDEERVEQMLIWVGPAAADALLRAFERGNPHRGVIRSAGMVGDSRLLDPLVEVLEGDDLELRVAAAQALGGLTDTRAVPALLHATQAPEQAVRVAASEALNAGGIAAVIVGVATIIHEASREQIEAPAGDAAALERPAAPVSPEQIEAQIAHPPTWAQGVLGRLRKRGRP